MAHLHAGLALEFKPQILQAGRRQLPPESGHCRHAHTDGVNKSIRRLGNARWNLQGKASAGESHNPHKGVVRKGEPQRPLSPGQGSLSLQPGTLVTRAMLRSSTPVSPSPPPELALTEAMLGSSSVSDECGPPRFT